MDPPGNIGLIPFHYNLGWLQKEGVIDLINKSWATLVIGSPTFLWETKSKLVKQSSQKWEKEKYKPPSQEK